MDIQVLIRKLVSYGVQTGLVPEEDVIYTTNRLLELFELDELEERDNVTMREDELEEVLKGMLDYAYEKGILKENSVVYRDLFDTKIMSMLMPRPSEVIRHFHELYECGNDKDKYDRLQILDVQRRQNKFVNCSRHTGRKRNDKNNGGSHSRCSFYFFGYAQKRTQSQKLAQYYVADQRRADQDQQ